MCASLWLCWPGKDTFCTLRCLILMLFFCQIAPRIIRRMTKKTKWALFEKVLPLHTLEQMTRLHSISLNWVIIHCYILSADSLSSFPLPLLCTALGGPLHCRQTHPCLWLKQQAQHFICNISALRPNKHFCPFQMERVAFQQLTRT